jgi:hypothetical protein
MKSDIRLVKANGRKWNRVEPVRMAERLLIALQGAIPPACFRRLDCTPEREDIKASRLCTLNQDEHLEGFCHFGAVVLHIAAAMCVLRSVLAMISSELQIRKITGFEPW